MPSMSASVMSSSLQSGKTPAFAQRTSMPPWRETASAAIRSQSAARPTSPWTNDTWPPPLASSAAAASPTPGSRPVTTTFAPAPAKTRAIPLPIPRVPPVTITVRPSTGVNIIDPSLCMVGQVALGERAGAGGEAGAELGGLGRELVVGADPGHQQQPPQHDERVQLRRVGRVERRHRPVALNPGVLQLGDVRVVLDERDGGREVV